ncbi:MAG: alpha-L-fucosidase [Planctomycetota bacterium]|nr:alpha-L-fucosidase [Planctomycetota bacterium]
MKPTTARNILLAALALSAAMEAPKLTFAQAAPQSNTIAAGGNETRGYDMAPETNAAVVKDALAALPDKIPTGPFKPDWDSIKANYKVPSWFAGAKFGIFMHWGLYTVPAHHNEWYEKHMYTDGADGAWHAQHFGPQAQFGYKDFIPMFTAAKWDPDAWALLFKKSGAKYVVPTAEHHENFANWDSQVTPFNAVKMGPKRDLMGDLSKAVRAQGLKFGVSNHGIENFQFINPPPAMAAEMKANQVDLYDPKWADFYNVADRSDAACARFLVNWVQRNEELIDKYQPDMLWFDNGVDVRYLDPLKLWVAAYYYNRASTWGKEVSISTKKAAYAPSGINTQTIGSIIDFEKIGARSPSGIRTGEWQVDDPIGTTWGYTTGMKISSPDSIVGRLIDTVSKNGNLLLNISPQPDGTISPEQQKTLLGIGQWLEANGEAIYDTHSWIRFSDSDTPADRRSRGSNIRFTVKGDDLYAIIVGQWPGNEVVIASLAKGKAPEGEVSSVTMLGAAGNLAFQQDDAGLHIKLPGTAPGKFAYAMKISGLKMNAPTTTESGNPN